MAFTAALDPVGEKEFDLLQQVHQKMGVLLSWIFSSFFVVEGGGVKRVHHRRGYSDFDCSGHLEVKCELLDL